MPKAGQPATQAARDAHQHALRPAPFQQEKPFVPDWAADPSLLPKRPPGKDKTK